MSVGLGVLVFLFMLFAFPADVSHAEDQMKHVLVFNSYHEGYRRTEELVKGIDSVFGSEFLQLQVDFEYMDAMRNVTPGYFQRLDELYRYKFRHSSYDLIICSDESAFSFLKECNQNLFPDTPIVFCGVNHFEQEMIEGKDLFAGVIEDLDVRGTLAAMIRLHPGCHQVYVVNDDTPKGRSVAKELEKVIPDFSGLEFVLLSGMTMEEIQSRVSRLSAEGLVLFLEFSRDASGQYFPCDESIRKVSSSSAVPVYGVRDFLLGKGIVGGALSTGYDQGRKAALLGIKILEGELPSHIPVIRKQTSRFGFDRRLLKRFCIDRTKLSDDSIIINDVIPERERLLVLHSYDSQMSWVRDIEAGIRSVLGDRKDLEIVHDYMDLKRYPRPEFVQKVHDLLRRKYEGRKFDVILASDDEAYRFLLAYRDHLFPEIPVVFCGVNDHDPATLEGHPLFTGLTSEIDVRGTLDLALDLHPRVKKVVVINDHTDFGKIARKKVEDVGALYRDRVEFVHLEDMDMSELRERVGRLNEEHLLLLLAFTQDRSNNVFSYEESIRLIAERAKVPIYGIWDFYLGHGMLGGMVTSGYFQGKTAASMVRRILDGEAVSDIPVVRQGPNRYMFDYDQLQRFGVVPEDLPEGSIILNRPESFYRQHRLLVMAVILVMAVLVSAVVVLAVNIRRRKKVEAELRYYATTDEMTGVLNRRTGLLFLERQMAQADRQGSKLCVCFADLNNLKEVNDNCGHDMGDVVIVRLCRFLSEHIRSSDILCRLGGDEFLAILPGCDLAAAEAMWRRIEGRVDRHNAGVGELYERVSVSHGFAEYDPLCPVGLDDLIRIADQAMYRDKERVKERR